MNHPRSGRGADARNVDPTENTIITVETITHHGNDLAVQSTQLSEADAEAITAAIRTSLVAVWEKVAAAYHGRVWKALNYKSWDDYCEAEFDGSRIRIPREQRQDVVTSLRDEGLSLRAIAAATGVDRKTVRNDLSQVGEMGPPAQPVTDRPAATTGIDGRTYARPAPDDVIDAEVVEDPPQPRKPRRKPMGDAFQEAVLELEKAVERIERLRADDRYPALLEVRPHIRGQVDDLAARLAGGAR